MTETFRIEVLAPEHNRSGFACGSDPLDRYLREQASQDMRRRTSVCYVAVDTLTGTIAGYYTLAASSVPLTDVTEQLAKKLPRYPLVPVAHLGRLAVGVSFQKRQLGAALLWDAGQRAMQAGMGVFALVVDAKDDVAAALYQHHGFTALSSNPLTLVLPIATLAKKIAPPPRPECTERAGFTPAPTSAAASGCCGCSAAGDVVHGEAGAELGVAI